MEREYILNWDMSNLLEMLLQFALLFIFIFIALEPLILEDYPSFGALLMRLLSPPWNVGYSKIFRIDYNCVKDSSTPNY